MEYFVFYHLKNFLLFSLIFFCLLGNNIAFGEYFKYSQKNINLQIPLDWQISSSEQINHEILSLTKDNMASINIYSFNFSEPITITGFYQSRTNSDYKDWIKAGAREGSDYETNRANADYSYIAIYTKNNSNEKIVTGEYFFIKGMNGYILSISAPQKIWKTIEPSLKSIIESFWIGKGPRIIVAKPKIESFWTMIGKNAMNQNNTETSKLNFQILNKKWEWIPQTRDFQPKEILNPVESKEDLFLSIGENLLSISKKEGKQNWSYKIQGRITQNLLVYNDLLYFITNGTTNALYAVFAKTGNILFKKNLNGFLYSHPIACDDKIFLIENSTLKTYEAETGTLIWENSENFNALFYPVAYQNTIFAVKNENILIALDIETGKKLWEKIYAEKILYPPTISNNTIIVCFNANNPINPNISIHGLDRMTGNELWKYANKFGLKSIPKMPSIIDNKVIVITEIETETHNNATILKLNSKTGKVLSEYIIEDPSGYNFSKAMITNNSAFFLRTLQVTKVLSIQKETKEVAEDNPLATEYIDKKQEINTYLIEINLKTGKAKKTILFKNKKFNINDILSINIYSDGMVIIQNDASSQLHIKFIK